VLNHARRSCNNEGPLGLLAFLCFQLLDKIDVDAHVPSYDACVLDVALIAVTQTGSDADTLNARRFAFGDAPAL
jgi:hypothetical protein